LGTPLYRPPGRGKRTLRRKEVGERGSTSAGGKKAAMSWLTGLRSNTKGRARQIAEEAGGAGGNHAWGAETKVPLVQTSPNAVASEQWTPSEILKKKITKET